LSFAVSSVITRRLAAVLGLLAVMLGAFGAHALKTRLTPEQMAVWDKGVLYQMFHTAVLLALAMRPRVPRGPALLFLGGILLFSGSLYALMLTQQPLLVWLTPLGGLCFLAGWTWLIFAREQ
jgi:uncharacterized membrane protein YgdD (TMEM256/DUF423 family)